MAAARHDMPAAAPYVRITGVWKYLYRAVDKAGATVDFLLTARRNRKAALRFLRKAANRHGVPRKVTIDKSGANTAAIESNNAEHDADIEIRQIKFLNNVVEQDHRAVKRMTRPVLGFKSFWSAAITIAGIEIMHMIRKGQVRAAGKLRPAPQFYALARQSSSRFLLPPHPPQKFAIEPPQTIAASASAYFSTSPSLPVLLPKMPQTRTASASSEKGFHITCISGARSLLNASPA